MCGKTLKIKFKPKEDVTIGEVSVVTMGAFKVDSGSSATASGTGIHNNPEQSPPLSGECVVDIKLSGMRLSSREPMEVVLGKEEAFRIYIYMDSGPEMITHPSFLSHRLRVRR